MKIAFRIAGCLLVLAGALAAQAQPQPLFNGRDLTGWVVMHGGQWTVEEGVLVGRNGTNWSTNPELSGSWLRTEKDTRTLPSSLSMQ